MLDLVMHYNKGNKADLMNELGHFQDNALSKEEAFCIIYKEYRERGKLFIIYLDALQMLCRPPILIITSFKI